MVKRHDMSSGVNELSGNPREYFEPVSAPSSISYPALDTTGRKTGGPVIAAMPAAGGTPAMRGTSVSLANSNASGIRNSINDGQASVTGMAGNRVVAKAPNRHPVNGQNPSKPIQRKPKR